MRNHLMRGLFATTLALSSNRAPLHAQTLSKEQAMLREIYKDLIEINTTESAGDTTVAAQAMAVRLRTAGFAANQLQLIVPSGGGGS